MKVEEFAYARQIPDGFTGCCWLVTEQQTRWYKNRQLHNETGPALVCSWGKYWYQNGIQHRLDGPAIILGNEQLFRIYAWPHTEETFWNHPLVIEHKLKKVTDWIVDDNGS